MRPKIVILVLVTAVGLIALAVVLKGVMGAHAPQEAQAPDAPPEESPSTNATIPQVSANSSNNAAILEQLRRAELAKGLDRVRELEAQGPGDQATVDMLLAMLSNREPEVRKSAVQSLVQLNATNAVPGLEQALALTEDPREKIVLMDAINYLKLPGDVAPPPVAKADPAGGSTPPLVEIGSPRKRDPSAPRPQYERKARTRGDAAQPAASGAQPPSPAPGTTSPQ